MPLFRSLSLMSLCLVGFCETSFAQDEPGRLEPVSDWVLDYADESCALRRAFGDQQSPVYLEMRQFQPGYNIQFTVYGDELSMRSRPVEFSVEPDTGPRVAASAYSVNFAESGRGILFEGNLYPSEILEEDNAPGSWSLERLQAREAEVQGIAVGQVFEHQMFLATGRLSGVMNAMRTCLDELMTHWGIDPEAHHDLTRAATPRNQESWARLIASRYPTAALRRGEGGNVKVRVMVGADGRPDECVVSDAIADESLQEAACEDMLTHAQFDPALDANGQPIRSYWLTSVIYSPH